MSNTAIAHDLTDLAANSATQTHGISAILAWPLRAAHWIAGEIAMNRNITELAELDDRVLRDIGIDRSEISSVVRHGRYR